MSENPYAEKPWLSSYDEGVPSHIDYPEMNIYEFLDNSAKEFGSRTAIWFLKNKISYKKLKDITDRLATALVNLGAKKGDVIAIMIPNFPQFIMSYYAILKAGCISTAVSVLHTEYELAYQLNDSGAKILIAWDNQVEKINKIKDRTPLRHIIITNLFDYAPLANPLGKKDPPEIAGTLQFLNLVNKTKPNPPKFEINAKEDVACLQYTGGTSGLPKGAMLTHYNIVSNCTAIYIWNISEVRKGKDTALTNLPLFHIYGQTVCMNFAISTGTTIALNPDPRDQKSLFEIIRATRPALFPGVPTMYMRLLERDDLEDYAKDLKSIRVCNTGAAPMPPEVLKEFEERTGGKIIEGYGMTETSPVTIVNPINGVRKIGSVGFPYPDTDVKIVDIDDYTKIVPQGESGEIMIKGPQVMKGYWNKPEETVNQLKGDWLLTGDIARMDEDGYFFIVDRKKDMINVSGFKVYPREIEDVLFEHEAIENAAIIGIPDPNLPGSEKVKGFIVLKDGYKESDEMTAEIKEFCRKNVSPYKVPKFIEFRKELPETLVGKVLRKDLKVIEAKRRGEEV
ncbi:MAG: long-chain fatty acid--CoA ligase [Promethearchaeota archaeon Loki_b32]|nr:MAG: long-chain fatty acid--CoA ligase [Candidatus Lokiarchaeota archaeon Loki_b32]